MFLQLIFKRCVFDITKVKENLVPMATWTHALYYYIRLPCVGWDLRIP